MKEQKTSFTEQVADDGTYITQNAEVPDDDRLYLKRRMKLPNEAADLWRDAPAEEYEAWNNRMREKYPERPGQEPAAEEPAASVRVDHLHP